MNPALLAAMPSTCAQRAVRSAGHSDPRRSTTVRACEECDRRTLHTVYRTARTTAYRCRRCDKVWRWVGQPTAAARVAVSAYLAGR